MNPEQNPISRIEKIIQSDPATFQNMANIELLDAIYAAEAAKISTCQQKKMAAEEALQKAYAIHHAINHILAGIVATACEVETLQAWLNPCHSLTPITETE